ncbi:uncharacterized protein BT62DRAFT_1079591 [Guyanagaster necrorhizus]|uniref:Uncharacterized protein n=1 Tax=Guyanagaster necrorhizus TaxID=856835 RepID=A0A9P8ANL9_9AGAR|nr:uncharacterized protein BT62DRAFT_1079591 [Guyanagaster necrorhizus MCA 3950]KAG7442055.1 hypothetical protein BT62DRAFT_1079591 [Guyanagaster necrorhizus MCA 3950]
MMNTIDATSDNDTKKEMRVIKGYWVDDRSTAVQTIDPGQTVMKAVDSLFQIMGPNANSNCDEVDTLHFLPVNLDVPISVLVPPYSNIGREQVLTVLFEPKVPMTSAVLALRDENAPLQHVTGSKLSLRNTPPSVLDVLVEEINHLKAGRAEDQRQREKDQRQREEDQIQREEDQRQREGDQVQREEDQRQREKDQRQREKDQIQWEAYQRQHEKDQRQREKDRIQREEDQRRREEDQRQQEGDQIQREEDQRQREKDQRQRKKNQRQWEVYQRQHEKDQRQREKDRIQREEDQRRREEDQRQQEGDQIQREEDQRQREKDQRQRKKNQRQWEVYQRQHEKDQRQHEKDQRQREEDQRQREKDQRQHEKHQRQHDKDRMPISSLQEQLSSLWEQCAEDQNQLADDKRRILDLEKGNKRLKIMVDEHDKTLEELRHLILLVAPLHIRVLLDKTKIKILERCQYTSWDALRNSRPPEELKAFIQTNAQLTAAVSNFIFECSDLRREGNQSAHSASADDVRSAIMQKPFGEERTLLEQLYIFVYGKPI